MVCIVGEFYSSPGPIFGQMPDAGDEFDIDPDIIISDRPELREGETASVDVQIHNTHVSVALNEALEQVRTHPFRPGELLHEQIRYKLNCEGYEVEKYLHLRISFPVSDELELGEVAFVVEVSDCGVLPEEA